tara:strand:+ start:197 stop:784 length:588 start_codon:yes stop_codon:yes gene_type:complete
MKLKLTLLAVAIVAAGFFIGCQGGALTPEQSSALVDAGRETSDALATEIAKAKADAAALPEGSDERATLEAVIAATEKVRAEMDEAVAYLVANQNDDGTIGPEQGVGLIAKWLPPPWGTIVAGAAGLIFMAARSRKIRAAAQSIASSIDRARKQSPKLADALNDPAVIAELQRAQSPLAKRIVDEAQGKKPAPLL